jgi:hypothetical protein
VWFRNTISSFVKSSDGQATQKKFWGELADQLERVEPGVVARAGLSLTSEGLEETVPEC